MCLCDYNPCPFVPTRLTAASLKSSCRTYTDSVTVWWPGELLLGQELGVVPVTVNCGPVAAEADGEREKLVQASGCGAACGGAAWALRMRVLQSHGRRESPERGHQRLKTLAFCTRAPVPQRKPRQGLTT